MKKKYLIVESSNDEAVFKALVKHINQTDKIEVGNADLEQIEFEIKSANEEQDSKALKEALKSIIPKIIKGHYDKIGIIWDMDEFQQDKKYPQTNDRIQYRISQMNNAIQSAIKELPLYSVVFENAITTTNQFVNLIVQEVKATIGCYFVHYQGKGELEDLLKVIKSKPSPIADCVDNKLPECLKLHNEKALRSKDLVKLWVNNYQRYDTLPKSDRNDKNTTWEGMMKRNIFDFSKDEVVELKELKDFLTKIVE
jgi:hypothetical protein